MNFTETTVTETTTETVTVVETFPVPTGKTTQRWFAAGYQTAMAEILAALADGGPEAAIAWARNNS